MKILNYHEVVNDRLGGRPIAVTYCPLCDSAVVFDRRTELGEHEFGVSGLLYNSNVLLFDRGGQPESLWSQMMAQGVSGPAAGVSLTPLPAELTTWRDWATRHPQTTVLSSRTGHARDYRASPYQQYFDSPRLMFPVRPLDNRLPLKEPVLGVWTDEAARAYPVSAFGREARIVEQELDGRRFTLEFDPQPNTVRVLHADEGLHWMYSFWFAWHAFQPETEIAGAAQR